MQMLVKKINDTVIKVLIGTDINKKKDDVIGSVELDIESQAQFIGKVTELLESGNRNIILDLSNINYIDSSGLWALYESHKKADQFDGRVILLNPAKDVARVLDITKMSDKIQIFTNEKDATKMLSETAETKSKKSTNTKGKA